MLDSSFANLPELAAQVIFHIYHHHQHISAPPLPSLSLDNPHISRLVRFCSTLLAATRLTATCVILALNYINRLAQKLTIPSSQQRQAGSEIRLFTIALHLSDSFLNDSSYTIKSWSEASSLPATEIATMQREALYFLNWDLNVSPAEFHQWTESVKSFSTVLECKKLTSELQFYLTNSQLLSQSSYLPSPPVSPQQITRPIRLTPVHSRHHSNSNSFATIMKPQRQKVVHRIDSSHNHHQHHQFGPLKAMRHSIAQASQLGYFDLMPLVSTKNFMLRG